MSVEYYTEPSLPFEEAKAKLTGALGGRYIVDQKSRYKPECEAFYVLTPSGAGVWVLKETNNRTGILNSIVFEVMLQSLPYLAEFMPWIEETLGVKVFDEIGIPWKES